MVSVPNDECLGLAPTPSSAGEDECARLPQPNLTLRYNSGGLSFRTFEEEDFQEPFLVPDVTDLTNDPGPGRAAVVMTYVLFLELQPELKQFL